MTTARIPIPYDEIAAFCRKWQIDELALFGSVLREDFRPDSDVDVLVTFAPDASKQFDSWLDMQEELTQILGRTVDLVSRRGVEENRNPYLKKHVLSHVEAIYVA